MRLSRPVKLMGLADFFVVFFLSWKTLSSSAAACTLCGWRLLNSLQISGREMFEFDPSLMVDDEEEENEVVLTSVKVGCIN